MTEGLDRRSVLQTFARSFLIQGSWNYRTMIGSGFAFAMLPALRRIFPDQGGDLDGALRRHLEHFNAHPYLSSMALGAAIRLEADGEDADTVRRFKLAVRGPLGSLGDALVWASWLPVVGLISLLLYWTGAPGWTVVAAFLVLYNAGHVTLRIWGFRTGLREGRRVGRYLGQAALGRWTDRLRNAATMLLGVLVGVLLASPDALGGTRIIWPIVAAAGFVTGAVVGHPVWRPAAVVVVSVVTLLTTIGAMR